MSAYTSTNFKIVELWYVYQAIQGLTFDTTGLATEETALDILAANVQIEDDLQTAIENLIDIKESNQDIADNSFSNGQSNATWNWSTNQFFSNSNPLSVIPRKCLAAHSDYSEAMDNLMTAIQTVASASGSGRYNISSSGLEFDSTGGLWIAWAIIRCY